MRLFKRERPRLHLRELLNKARPGFVARQLERGHRQMPVSEKEALKRAVGSIRSDYAVKGDRLEQRFLSSSDPFEAEQIAALLAVLNSERAVSAFERKLESDSEPLRKVAARGITNVIRSTELKKDREYALDVIERAANRGVGEAAKEIKENLLDFGFRSYHKKDLKDIFRMIQTFSILVLSSPLLTIGAITGSALSFRANEPAAGLAMFAAAFGTYVIQRYTHRSE